MITNLSFLLFRQAYSNLNKVDPNTSLTILIDYPCVERLMLLVMQILIIHVYVL